MFIILFEIDLLPNPTILFSPLIIHISVDIVYAGIGSPIKGINSIVFIAVASLLPVILNKRLLVMTSNMSPITGMSKTGAAI
jgi:hypothetical protein